MEPTSKPPSRPSPNDPSAYPPEGDAVTQPESARGRLADVMSRGEAALLSGDPERRAAWLRDVEAAERELHAARTGPSWAALLADPTLQPAGAGEVTASVLAYQDAPLTSACACGGSLHKACAASQTSTGVDETPADRASHTTAHYDAKENS